MDTRTPPIPLKHQEKNLHPSKKYEHSNVSLPPLTPLASQRQKRKPLATPWNRRPPNIPQPQEYSRQRPYRVLHIGATPLMHACQQGDRARVLRLLKEQESTIGYRDRTLRSALHYCMDAGTGGAVAMTAPELVNAPDAEGHTPLHLAVIAGDTQLVAVLLANGADVNAKDVEGHSVLHWATVCGEAECVRLVLTSGARPSTPDLRGGSPLHYAAQCCGTTATAELSVPKKVGLKVLQTLLEYGADVNAKDEDGRQPILWAASAGSVEAVLALSRAGGSAAAGASDKDGLTALHCAASRGHARCVEALVNLCGSHPDHVDDNGCSALHYAATLGHADATALILKLGADPNRQDRKGRTPALCAAAKGQLETLKILAQHGGSLHARTVRGTGIAHEAVASGRIELMKWLAKKRPSILDVATQDGRTPLHVAALHGHLDACKVLLDHGARVNAVLRTSKNIFMTPLDAALHKGHRDCAKLIQMHGGTTAQQIRSHKLPQAKVFSRKLHPKDTDSSTESDSSPCRRKDKRPDLYYEERWIERRTRRRGRKIAKRDSRSFSEEELRLSKTSRRDCCERRARSESARYESEEGKKSSEEPVSPKKFSKRKNDRSSSKSDSLASRDDVSSDVSVSEDSLEVVVVRKSLERKEKIVSGRRSPRKVSRSRRKSSRRKGESSSKAKEARQGANLHENGSTLREDKSGKIHFERDITDSTSQENIQRVTVTAIVHKSPPPETPRISVEVSKEVSVDPSGRSGISKSESSKSGSVSEKENESQGAESPETKSQEPEAKISEEGLETEKKSESSVSKEESGQSRMEESPKIDTRKGETDKSDSQTRETPEVARDLESKEELSEKEEKKEVKNVEDSENVKLQKSSDSKEQSFDADKNSEGHRTEDEEEKDENGEENPSKSIEDENTRTDSEKSMKSTNLDTLAIGGTKGTTDEKKNERKSSKGSLDRKQSKAKLGRPVKSDESGKNVTKTEVEEDKDQVDSARGKSLEHSSRESSRTDTPKSQEKSGDVSEKDENSPFHEETKKFSAEEVSSKGSKTRRPSTGKGKRRSSRKLFQSSSKDRSPERSAIIAVIESPEWDEEDEEVEKEIRDVIGDDAEQDTEPEDDGIGVVRILPSTSEEEISRVRTSLPQVYPRNVRNQSPQKEQRGRLKVKQREDSGGRDSGIEPSPRVSRIPRRNVRCYPNSAKQQTLHMETVMRDVHISLRRYHLERKIFFQLMELKRLQIRHGRANEHVLVKRQVDSFNKSGMTGPTLGVVKYEQPLTFRDFESFLYEQLRRLQRRPATPDWCTEAKQCTQKTHRCHHATSAYTSLPVYTYLGGTDQECARSLLPKIESRGKGQMRVEVTHGEEKQVIALPTEKLDRTKRYFVTFTVRGETTFTDKPKSLINLQRSAKSV